MRRPPSWVDDRDVASRAQHLLSLATSVAGPRCLGVPGRWSPGRRSSWPAIGTPARPPGGSRPRTPWRRPARPGDARSTRGAPRSSHAPRRPGRSAGAAPSCRRPSKKRLRSEVASTRSSPEVAPGFRLDHARVYREWSARGATFLTEPKDHGREIRASFAIRTATLSRWARPDGEALAQTLAVDQAGAGPEGVLRLGV
jgi:hypothetical protein